MNILEKALPKLDLATELMSGMIVPTNFKVEDYPYINSIEPDSIQIT